MQGVNPEAELNNQVTNMNRKKIKIYLDDEIQSIQSQLEQSQKVIHDLKDKSFFKNKEIEQKRFLLTKKIEELENTNDIIENKKEENLNLYSEIKSLEAKIVELNFKNKSTQKSDLRLQERREKLEEIVDKLNHTLFKKNQLEFEGNSKNDLVKIVEKNIFQEQQKLSTAQAEVTALEEVLQAKRLEVDTWVKTSTNIAKSLKENQERINKSKDEIQSKEGFLKKASKTTEQLKSQERVARNKSQEVAEYYESLKSSIAATEKENQELQARIKDDETLLSDLKSKSRELTKNQKTIERETNKAELRGRKLKAKEKELSQVYGGLKSQTEKQEILLEKMNKEINRLEGQGTLLSENIKNLKIEISQNNRNISQKKEHTHRTKTQLSSDVKVYNLLREKNNSLEIENKKNQQDIIELEHKSGKLAEASQFEQERFTKLNRDSSQISSNKRSLELNLDEKLIEAETSKALTSKTRKPKSQVALPIDKKKIDAISKESTQMNQFFKSLLKTLEVNNIFAQSFNIVDHKDFYEVKISDLFDAPKKIINVFSTLKSELSEMKSLQFGYKLNQNKDRNDIQIIVKPSDLRINKEANL